MKKFNSSLALSVGFLLSTGTIQANTDQALDLGYGFPLSEEAIHIFSTKEEVNPFEEIIQKRKADQLDALTQMIEDSKEDLIAQVETAPISTLDIEKGKEDVLVDQPNEEIVLNPEEEIPPEPKTILINFNNVSVIEYIRFISRFTNKNFVFDEGDLDFRVTVVSEEGTTLENVMTTLLQELRIHGLTMIEQGNNLIIHKSDGVSSISNVSVDETPAVAPRDHELVTQVFRLNTLDPTKAASIIKPLISKQALLEVSKDSQQIIVTDLVSNIEQISKLLKGIDSPSGGLVIGQYMVKNAYMDSLIELTKQIMTPIAGEQSISMIPHPTAQSVFVVASPFLVERTLSVMQHIDQKEGQTKIFDLDDLKFQPITPGMQTPQTEAEKGPATGEAPEGAVTPQPGLIDTGGRWEIDPNGKWIFRPGAKGSAEGLPRGRWVLDPQGKWYFLPEGAEPPPGFDTERLPTVPLGSGETPKGSWGFDKDGNWVFQLTPGEVIKPESLIRKVKPKEDLPVGHIERTKFLLLKLKNRSGEDVIDALQNIGTSLDETGVINDDLLLSINSAQWIEPTNSIVITGTEDSIDKVRELVKDIDESIRQVFIEMLILETDVDDSLRYGVDWGTRSCGGSTSTAQAFLGGASELSPALFGADCGSTPEAAPLAQAVGFTIGVIGQRITHNGTQFADIGALVRFIHSNTRTNIIMNPKVITEDNKPAEIFVGINTPFQDESISNDEGSIITTNVEFRDVGTTLNVTPHIGNNDMITLEIQLENSSVGDQGSGGSGLQPISTTPTTRINRTNTTVRVPDGFFVVLSGMIQDEIVNDNNQVPCLGGIPILGGGFKRKERTDQKRNLMIFIRPQIVDTEEDYHDLTSQQQEIHKQKSRARTDWKYEMDEALEFLNIDSRCDPCEPCD